jgi:hypothetical protein
LVAKKNNKKKITYLYIYYNMLPVFLFSNQNNSRERERERERERTWWNRPVRNGRSTFQRGVEEEDDVVESI